MARANGARLSGPIVTSVLTLIMLPLLVGGASAFAQATASGLAPAVKAPRSTASPEWRTLSAAQQTALGPLAPIWGDIGESRQRKWLALSQNYATLSPAAQATLHGRMREWAALSPAQRNQARINFTQTQSLSPEEKKARWEAYQALSPDQKQKLAKHAQPRAVGAAPAVTPVAPNKLATVPITRSDDRAPDKPRIKRPKSDSETIPGSRR